MNLQLSHLLLIASLLILAVAAQKPTKKETDQKKSAALRQRLRGSSNLRDPVTYQTGSSNLAIKHPKKRSTEQNTYEPTPELEILSKLFTKEVMTSEQKTKLAHDVMDQCSEGTLNGGNHDRYWRMGKELIDDDNWKPSPELKSTGSLDCDRKLSPYDVQEVYTNPKVCECYVNYRPSFTYRVLIHNSIQMNCCLFFADPLEDPALDSLEKVEGSIGVALEKVMPYVEMALYVVKETIQNEVPSVQEQLIKSIMQEVSSVLDLDEKESKEDVDLNQDGWNDEELNADGNYRYMNRERDNQEKSRFPPKLDYDY